MFRYRITGVVLAAGFLLTGGQAHGGSALERSGLTSHLMPAALLSSPTVAGPVTLPIDLSTGRPVVLAQSNGAALKVIVDTGGPNGVVSGGVDAGVADRLKLPVTGKSQIRSPAAGGKPVEVDLHQVPSLGFGAHGVENLSLNRFPNMPGDILIGNSVLGRSGKIVELDLSTKQLRLVEAPTAAVAQWYPLAPNGHLHTSITIGGKSYPATIDTGFPGQLTIPRSAMDQVPLASAPKVVGRARTVDSEFEIMGADMTADVLIGDLKLPISSTNLGPFPRVVVGTAALKDFTILIDWKNRRFALVRSNAAGAKPI